RLDCLRMLVQYRFDLGWIDVEAGADNQLFAAADNVKGVTVELREIARIEPALGVDNGCGRLGGAIIAAHDVGPADVQFADLAWTTGAATTLLYQTCLNAGDQ